MLNAYIIVLCIFKPRIHLLNGVESIFLFRIKQHDAIPEYTLRHCQSTLKRMRADANPVAYEIHFRILHPICAGLLYRCIIAAAFNHDVDGIVNHPFFAYG